MTSAIESVSKESRIFQPPATFASAASLGGFAAYQALYRQSIESPDLFWKEQAKKLRWERFPSKTLTWDPPHATWFEDGTLNIAVNCLDRHLEGPRADKVALIWEGESYERRTYTYRQLSEQVCRCANALERLGVAPSDRVGIYLGMVPEAVIAMLACARIGAVHTVIFGGFSAEAVQNRLHDAGAKVVITQDGTYRRGRIVPLKAAVDTALEQVPSVQHVLVVRRTGEQISMTAGRDHEWTACLDEASPAHSAQAFPAEHPLFILYTSGTTGKPKGVLHTTGGYAVGTHITSEFVFDLKDDDIYWCSADVGWVTGHSYVVYGPLSNGTTVLTYEGAPNHPHPGRFWEIIAKHKATIFYTAPTAIRAFMRLGDAHVEKHDLSSLRLLGTVGEPINPEAWIWYQRVIGGGRCPIVDTWWQTETGCIMLSPIPGAIATKPGSCTLPFFGVVPRIVDDEGNEAPDNAGGLLVIDRPWPSMLRTVFGDDARYVSQYFSRFGEERYFTGDGARKDEDGYFWVMGRIDDVVNVAGHRLGTAEVESILVAHPSVAEAAVVGRPHEIKGQALVAFVTPMAGREASETLRTELLDAVTREIGKFARPDELRFADALPKTRSGKIMRRLLKDLASGNTTGDTTTLEDAQVLRSLEHKSHRG